MRRKSSNLFWGTFLLLAAALVLMHQVTGFTDIGIGSILAVVLSAAFIVQCIARLDIAFLPIPIAALYVVFRTPLDLPYIRTGMLAVATVLAVVGLGALFPRKRWRVHRKFKCCGKSWDPQQVRVEDSGDGNSPFISVSFGSAKRRLRSDNLEGSQLNCSFGELVVRIEEAGLPPSSAEVIVNCSFGSVVLIVPGHWQVVDQMSCSLGGVDIEKLATPTENAPKLTLVGSVSFGSVEVRYA